MNASCLNPTVSRRCFRLDRAGRIFGMPLLALAALLCGCKTAPVALRPEFPTQGGLLRIAPELDDLIAAGSPIEVVADGFGWTDGPAWLSAGDCLLFSDVPANTLYTWKKSRGVAAYLKPAGYTGAAERKGLVGAGGIAIDSNGSPIICQLGDRRVSKLERSGILTLLAGAIDGRRFNSPNDLAISADGDICFTDPPYGLAGGADDPARELPFCGVYRIGRGGRVQVLQRQLSLPNGVAFSPGGRRLYVSNSDAAHPMIMVYPVNEDGTLAEGKVFFDCAHLLKAGAQGLPDGLKVDEKGNVFATGPGGVLVLSPAGRHMGTILTGTVASNCAWGDDGGTLYITAGEKILRIRTLTRGKIGGLQ